MAPVLKFCGVDNHSTNQLDIENRPGITRGFGRRPEGIYQGRGLAGIGDRFMLFARLISAYAEGRT